jgi:hypothetical protein
MPNNFQYVWFASEYGYYAFVAPSTDMTFMELSEVLDRGDTYIWFESNDRNYERPHYLEYNMDSEDIIEVSWFKRWASEFNGNPVDFLKMKFGLDRVGSAVVAGLVVYFGYGYAKKKRYI